MAAERLGPPAGRGGTEPARPGGGPPPCPRRGRAPRRGRKEQGSRVRPRSPAPRPCSARSSLRGSAPGPPNAGGAGGAGGAVDRDGEGAEDGGGQDALRERGRGEMETATNNPTNAVSNGMAHKG